MTCKYYASYEGICCNADCPYCADLCPVEQHQEVCNRMRGNCFTHIIGLKKDEDENILDVLTELDQITERDTLFRFCPICGTYLKSILIKKVKFQRSALRKQQEEISHLKTVIEMQKELNNNG